MYPGYLVEIGYTGCVDTLFCYRCSMVIVTPVGHNREPYYQTAQLIAGRFGCGLEGWLKQPGIGQGSVSSHTGNGTVGGDLVMLRLARGRLSTLFARGISDASSGYTPVYCSNLGVEWSRGNTLDRQSRGPGSNLGRDRN